MTEKVSEMQGVVPASGSGHRVTVFEAEVSRRERLTLHVWHHLLLQVPGAMCMCVGGCDREEEPT